MKMRRFKTRVGMKKRKIFKKYYLGIGFVAAIILTCAAFILSSCTPTYPKEKLPEAIKNVCEIEYGMKVDVSVMDSTVGIYYPMEGLLDVGLGISKDAWDQISNLILVASRVVLSTDADVKFYCVITQDVRLPELQVVIIKYVEDVKHGMYRNISRSESFKRTLFSVNLTPQAKKERTVEKIFENLGVEDDTREKVLDEFFRSPPTKLSDIGYWKGHFYLKSITLGEFLAAQMASRIKIDFRQDEKLMEFFQYKSSEGEYMKDPEGEFFLLKFKIADQRASDGIIEMRKKKVQEILRIANEVVRGYKFQNFKFLKMEDQLENVDMFVGEEDIYDFDKEKLSIENIVQTSGNYF